MPTTAQADWNKQAHGRAPEYGTTPQTRCRDRGARAGATGHNGYNARYALYFGLAGVVVAFALIYAAFFA